MNLVRNCIVTALVLWGPLAQAQTLDSNELLSSSISCPSVPTGPGCVNERNGRRAREFLTDIPVSRARWIVRTIDRLNHSPKKVAKISEPAFQSTPIVVFVQGIRLGDGYEWYRAFDFLLRHGFGSYLIKIDPRDSIIENGSQFGQAIKQIRQSVSGRKIVIFGYSAGGVVALEAWKDPRLASLPEIRLVTIASPLGGYDAPPLLSELIVPFMGRMVQELGQSQESRFGSMRMANCTHHVTTRCDLDFHACLNDSGLSHQQMEDMPCQETRIHPEVDHHVVLLETLENELLGFPIPL